jgi:hypothetical protein
MKRLRWVVILLALTNAGWMAFDGTHAARAAGLQKRGDWRMIRFFRGRAARVLGTPIHLRQ